MDPVQLAAVLAAVVLVASVVSVELGMNDKGGTTTEKFIENMGTMVKTIRATGARPVILAPSPVHNGYRLAALGRAVGRHAPAAQRARLVR